MPTLIDPLNDPDHLEKTMDAIKALAKSNEPPMRSKWVPCETCTDDDRRRIAKLSR